MPRIVTLEGCIASFWMGDFNVPPLSNETALSRNISPNMPPGVLSREIRTSGHQEKRLTFLVSHTLYTNNEPVQFTGVCCFLEHVVTLDYTINGAILLSESTDEQAKDSACFQFRI